MIRRLNTNQLLQKIHNPYIDSVSTMPASDHLQFIEIGAETNFDETHLPRAIHLEPSQVQLITQKKLLPTGRDYILYSETYPSSEIEKFGKIFLNNGYFNLYVYTDGKKEWLKRGLSRETSKVPADHLK